jgi:hypothetical protein
VANNLTKKENFFFRILGFFYWKVSNLFKFYFQDVAYGVVTLLVNLTNSYEKQEIMPELIELAKFAKHHIPQDHELDDQDFIDKRIWVIFRNPCFIYEILTSLHV